MTESEQKLDKQEARQGNSRHMNYRVLLWSVALAVIAVVLIFAFANMGGGA